MEGGGRRGRGRVWAAEFVFFCYFPVLSKFSITMCVALKMKETLIFLSKGLGRWGRAQVTRSRVTGTRRDLPRCRWGGGSLPLARRDERRWARRGCLPAWARDSRLGVSGSRGLRLRMSYTHHVHSIRKESRGKNSKFLFVNSLKMNSNKPTPHQHR